MAIITFKSNEIKETAQTLSIAAVAAQMAIEHNYKILLVSTNFKDKTLEECFWDVNKKTPLVNMMGKPAAVGIESGVEGLMRVMASNKTSPEIVKNYSKIILRDRLDVLPSPSITEYKDYENIAAAYPEILQLANRYYDIILVDLSERMSEQYAENIIQISDIVVVNLTQRLKSIDDFIELREAEEFYKRKHIMLLIGRYDSFSKYNTKNITRYMKEKKPVNVIPYNTLFFEACSEAKIIDFFLRLKNIDELDRNYLFIKEVTNMGNNIIYKLQELQMKL